MPDLSDPSAFGKALMDWYKAVQPPWRSNSSLSLAATRSVPEGEQWETISKGGLRGVHSILVGLSWWHEVSKGSERRLCQAATKEVCWLFNQLIASLEEKAG